MRNSSRTKSGNSASFRSRHSSSASSGCAPGTSGPGAGWWCTISRCPRSDGGARTIIPIPMPGESAPESAPLPSDPPGSYPFLDYFSDEAPSCSQLPGTTPVEMVPTPDKFPRLNRYFWKISILNGKKPANIAGFGWRGKIAQAPAGFQGNFAIRKQM